MNFWNIGYAVAVVAAVIGLRMGQKPTWESNQQRKRSEASVQI